MFENRRKAILYIICSIGLLLFVMNNFKLESLLFLAIELASIMCIYVLSRNVRNIDAQMSILIFLAITISSSPDADFQFWQCIPLFMVVAIMCYTNGMIFASFLNIGISAIIFPSAVWFIPIVLAAAILFHISLRRTITLIMALTCPLFYYFLFKELIWSNSLEAITSFFSKAVHMSTPFANMHPLAYLLLLVSIIPAVNLVTGHNYLAESKMSNVQNATLLSFVSIVLLYFVFNSGMGSGPLAFYIAIPAAITAGIMFSSESSRRTDSLFYIFAMILLLNTLTNYFSL